MESVSRQIDALREAFSADISKPFDLRPGFPFGSPTPTPSEIPLSSAYTQAHNPNLRVSLSLYRIEPFIVINANCISQ
jgi:hypothetical protein